MRRRCLPFVVLVALAFPGIVGASTTAPSVAAASLNETGQDLVWKVSLNQPFTAGSLKRARASLCLALGRPNTGTLTATICVVPGRHNRPKLVENFGARGRRAVPATVTRPTGHSLTASFLPTTAGLDYRPLRWQAQATVTHCARPSGCTSVFPQSPAFLNLRVPKLIGCVPRGPDEVFHGPTKVHDIALTFDDGPWNDPPSIRFVDELARLHVPGTFFEIGEQISIYDPHGTVERAMLAHGDMIGDHTWTHPNMLSLSPAAQRSQLGMTNAAIKRATGFQVCLFRPPGGSADSQLVGLARSMGMATIMWDIDPRDWSLPGVGSIEGTIFSEARNGGIIEAHFGGGPRSETLDSLPDVVKTLRAKGYTFVTLTQMLGYRLIYK
jgi:peptidoglycan/xylan/chitin deacetylase (PgdA/CDA1 family)